MIYSNPIFCSLSSLPEAHTTTLMDGGGGEAMFQTGSVAVSSLNDIDDYRRLSAQGFGHGHEIFLDRDHVHVRAHSFSMDIAVAG